jgi:hypothetical protein
MTNAPDPLNRETVKLPYRTLADGSIVFPVPSPLPDASRLVFAHAPAERPEEIADAILTMPRGEIEAYAAFLARHGAIDRAPTADELNITMQIVGNALVEAQIDLMGKVTDFLVERLGCGDREQAARECTESIAGMIAAEATKAGALPAEEVHEAREQIARAIREWAERNNPRTDGEEAGS